LQLVDSSTLEAKTFVQFTNVLSFYLVGAQSTIFNTCPSCFQSMHDAEPKLQHMEGLYLHGCSLALALFSWPDRSLLKNTQALPWNGQDNGRKLL
jgi:hypothetical protein